MMSLRVAAFHSPSLHILQRRPISLLHKIATTGTTLQQRDVDHAVLCVRQYDPAGYLPGRLLSEKKMSIAYYAARSFWVESGLRFGSTAKVAANATPADHLEWWQHGIDEVFASSEGDLSPEWQHPTLRLIHSLLQDETPWTKDHFNDILDGRRKDLNIKQYETLDELVHHAEQSCGRYEICVTSSI
jgi:hypothetical protein